MNPGDFSRRRFLIGSFSALGSAWLVARWPMIAAAQEHVHRAVESGQAPAFQFFSPEQAAEIEAMAAQIIPADDTPGAREARVIYFIDHVLTTFERDQQPLYRQGLTELQDKTRESFPGGNKFSELTSGQQVQLLTAIEKSEFFEIVRLHTIVGFLSNPEYGGNHDRIGWKLIAFEDAGAYEPPFGYYDREINKGDGR
jgi:gluconate 2-dehydrogenase gamma chain